MSERARSLFVVREIDEITMNPFKQIGQEWMLITAGTLQAWNTMTAAWGGFGFLWGKPTAFAFVRFTRYTYEFMERSSHFTLSFFGSAWRKALMTCGTKSGRDIDKVKETGLNPIDLTGSFHISGEAMAFEQARQVFACRKLYSSLVSPEQFTADELHSHYPDKDYHHMYVGEIESVLEKKS